MLSFLRIAAFNGHGCFVCTVCPSVIVQARNSLNAVLPSHSSFFMLTGRNTLFDIRIALCGKK